MTTTQKATAITQATTISIALVLSIAIGAYWVGSRLTETRMRLDVHSKEMDTLESLLREVVKMNARQNERLDRMEQR